MVMTTQKNEQNKCDLINNIVEEVSENPKDKTFLIKSVGIAIRCLGVATIFGSIGLSIYLIEKYF